MRRGARPGARPGEPARPAGRGSTTTAVPITPRTTAALVGVSAVGALAFLWPLLLTSGAAVGATSAPLVLAVVVLAAVTVTLVSLSDGGIDVRAVAVLGVLTALGAVLRPLAAGTAGVETVFVTIILGGRVFGPGLGFTLGASTLFTSALLTGGVGPWLPFQMLAAAWVGLGAGLLPRRPRGRTELALLAGYGALAALGFGLAMNLSFWPFQLGGGTALSFAPGAAPAENAHRFLLYSLTTSLGWDLGRALTTAVGLALLGSPVLATLRRAAVRARFAPPAPGATTGR